MPSKTSDPDTSPTTKEVPGKAKTPTTTSTTTKKQTAAEARKELADLKESAGATRQRLTQAEITAQRCRTVLKNDGTPGMTLQQDHYRLKQMVDELRKILGVTPEQISGG